MALQLPALDPESGLQRYMREIKRFPMLSEEEEYMLARRWQEHEDLSAAHRLVTSHLRLVAKIAHGFRGYGLPLVEMISEGNIGLMQAVKKFDPERGFRLSTYAIWWIRASIQEYILQSWSLVKVGTSAAQKRLFFNLRRLKQRINAVENRDLSPDEVSRIAGELDVREEEVVHMNRRMIAHDQHLNSSIKHDGEDGAQWIDMLADERETHDTLIAEKSEWDHKRSLMQRAMDTLNPREQRILSERRLKDPASTLETLSREFGISRERVRQIENRAFEKLQAALKALPEAN